MLGAVIATEDSNLGHVLVLFFMCIVFLCSVQHTYDTVFHAHCTVPLIPVQQGVTFGVFLPDSSATLVHEMFRVFFMRTVLIFFPQVTFPLPFFSLIPVTSTSMYFFFCLYSHPCLCTQT